MGQTRRKPSPQSDLFPAAPEVGQAATSTPEDGASPEHQFLRLMSHEMRTPLNGVIGMLGLLSRTRLDGAQRAYAEAAQKSAEHLLGLVNDLLDYARLEAEALEFDPAPVELEGLVRGVAELLSPRAHDKGLEIVWSVAADAPDVVADEGRLRQILFNLAGNAVKFTDRGGVRLAVEAVGERMEGAPARLAFIVDDTGPGVPEEARGRIFEEFGHADVSDAARFDGAGLGLAVVRRLARAMDGDAVVEDRPDGPGARFRFEAEFPVAADAEARTRLLDGLVVAVRSPNPFVRRAAADQIEASGGRVARQAGVTLIDHAGVEGGALAVRPGQGQAIILLRPSERDLISRYRAAGFCGYLIKPLRRESLAERVRAAAAPRRGLPTPPVRSGDDDRVAHVAFKGVRVLLVEDNPVGALLAKTLLRREGCVVQTAADGQEALDALKAARFDLVFMDMRMPRLDGPSAARALRARGDQTPIIALTANAFAEDRVACLEAGMDDHLAKPLEADALRVVLARWTNAANRAKVAVS
ncbi:response regulator [Brevundimonas diminuta]|uniref:histidine kinase n=1 Tax=Brevundimonas diminuta TaxID=293 RepID=A0A1Z3LXM6_BREDI|nr:response regulator [Brevundimonas diminuta]ASD26886.1 hybrid sensor histidine kinase/response regulator [Brevundimonas diminuta]